MRGPTWRSFSAGGDKTLFRIQGCRGRPSRVAVCEAAIDALSLAAIESCRLDTLYTATAGGMGPAAIAALQQLLQILVTEPAGMLVATTDADGAMPPGCRRRRPRPGCCSRRWCRRTG